MQLIFKSDKILSLIIVVSSCAWGLYWLPLRSIEQSGIVGSWSIVFVNACPLIILVPLIFFNLDKKFNLNVYDISGKLIKMEKNLSENYNLHLKSGFYILEINYSVTKFPIILDV